MSTIPEQELTRLIAKGEGVNLDFKHSITSTYKIAKALCAFANAGGGVLLIGVKDNGKPAKINVSEEAYMLESAVNKCKPDLEYEVTECILQDRQILHVDVKAGAQIPYMALNEEGKWLAYVRVADSNVLANWIWLQVARIKQKGINTKIDFGTLEADLLTAIEAHPGSTQSQLAQVLGIGRSKLGRKLVTLVSMGVVQMELSREGAFFYSQNMNKG